MSAAEHHASASSHHEKAAGFHRDAARHFETGKDYNHAAHQAQMAHWHSLQALDDGNKAVKYYAEHDDAGAPSSPDITPRFPVEARNGSPAATAGLSVAEHHAAAARHHDLATRYHRRAAEHGDKKSHALSAHEAHIAHDHAELSLFHGDEAAKHHSEHYGKSGPTAEIA